MGATLSSAAATPSATASSTPRVRPTCRSAGTLQHETFLRRGAAARVGPRVCARLGARVVMVESATRKMLHRLPRHLLRTHASDTAKQPLIAHLSEMGASPFLLDLAMAILGRVSLYQSEVLPNQESTPLASRKFRVWFHAHATSPGTTEGRGSGASSVCIWASCM